MTITVATPEVLPSPPLPVSLSLLSRRGSPFLASLLSLPLPQSLPSLSSLTSSLPSVPSSFLFNSVVSPLLSCPHPSLACCQLPGPIRALMKRMTQEHYQYWMRIMMHSQPPPNMAKNAATSQLPGSGLMTSAAATPEVLPSPFLPSLPAPPSPPLSLSPLPPPLAPLPLTLLSSP